ncbi:winged helix-turn-helix transcriptional regulator [Erythrobacter insulae]|uniref:Winged helix-turn-helix transcriptional regulator n=1 Tax=Erythrobacter insulae TaxID=2584124 RepID=A0A547PDE8_9SPHN|nr:metalloregulator ArsR/SmtB family transcription factor [Erythrobacter insulae]TRD12166.1 winged helix-turn-helix transcriptional regulator [Erythrobacter insulae]
MSVFEALSHPIRRQVLEMLKGGGMSAGEIADAFDVSKPTMSGHFAKLKSADLIVGENRAGTIIYTLNMSTLEEAVMGFMGRVRRSGAKSDAPESQNRRQPNEV